MVNGSNTLHYAGYVAAFGYDESASAFCGRVLGTTDVIDFYGRTVEELEAAFRESIEAYLAWRDEELTSTAEGA